MNDVQASASLDQESITYYQFEMSFLINSHKNS